jgi:hypothetical protein
MVDDRHSPLMHKTNAYPYAAIQNYHQMMGNRQWLNFMMPYIQTEPPLSLNMQKLDSSLSPSVSPAKSSSTSYSDNDESPKKCNFSIASILGL